MLYTEAKKEEDVGPGNQGPPLRAEARAIPDEVKGDSFALGCENAMDRGRGICTERATHEATAWC